VRHYWLADPDIRVLEVYELSEGQYRRAASLADGDTFSPPLLPGLAIPLSSLWG
jgi:Uma2 family endonuclease